MGFREERCSSVNDPRIAFDQEVADVEGASDPGLGNVSFLDSLYDPHPRIFCVGLCELMGPHSYHVG